jgi:hypothetical protein
MLLRWWIFGGMGIISSAQTLTTLVSFNGANGTEPYSGSLVSYPMI